MFIIALLLNGCSNGKQEVKENIKVATTPREVFIFAGKIQANNSVNLASKVLKVTVDVGSTVKAGDPIIYLDTTDLQNQEKQAEAKVNTAESTLNKT
jgi:HlyD family secretion protein